ncbi:FAD-dependent oxidoreductase [Amycolatopsis sp. NPDC051071]|uniref:FAD-dependent oxidoreductase n=1 Tax=Amycolatopsis sp. NPDC051071 TaxID=3154637 RepID=UPI0034395F2B
MTELPVVVIGAGPVGLATAAHLLKRGVEPVVLEAGSEAGSAVAEWAHVRLFSPWSQLVDLAAAELLTPTGWSHPDADVHPTGGEWLKSYLRPLAQALGDRVRVKARVTGVARRGQDRISDVGRGEQPLAVHVAGPTGDEVALARAVIDASGTWATPSPLGSDGIAAPGEHAAEQRISYRVPDLAQPAQRQRYAGRRIAIAGSGHSALTALVVLTALAEECPGTEIVWLLRRETPVSADEADSDQLPARGALGSRATAAARSEHVRVVAGFRTAAVEQGPDGLVILESVDGRRLEPVDEVLALTGFRPDLSFLGEVRLDLDPVLQAPRALAELIDPAVHSCGTAIPHGVRELTQPEPDVFMVGMKSYGRAPTFLAMTGYEQVRSVAAALAGDHDAATRVELALPIGNACGEPGIVAGCGEAGDSACGDGAGPQLLDLRAPTSARC